MTDNVEDSMKTRPPLPPPVANLYAAVAELEQAYKGRKFTLDGHLLVSVGEVLAETALRMRRLKMSAPVHDAMCADRGDVQIKITARGSVALRHPCNPLVIFQAVSPSEAEISYDGSGKIAWDNAGPMQSNGQRSISLTKIEALRPDRARRSISD
jgi:hypothetical protein